MFGNAGLDIAEDRIATVDLSLLNILLKDQTTGKNIIWATTDYALLGEDYAPSREILPPLITKRCSKLIQPRIAKACGQQTQRTKDKAEVFTPAWVCNEQNNLIDEAWFDRKSVFNISEDHGWRIVKEKVIFPVERGRTWKDYVDARRLEITCGEAPYLASRYDAVSGEMIDLQARIGLLDRKLRIVNENTDDEAEWMKWTERAFQSIYGYEYQGDNLLLARENLLFTFIDNMIFKLDREPTQQELRKIATILSWNLWQMDGLTNRVPCCNKQPCLYQPSLFDMTEDDASDCLDFSDSLLDLPEQPLCKIKDWRAKEIVEFSSLLKGRHNGK